MQPITTSPTTTRNGFGLRLQLVFALGLLGALIAAVAGIYRVRRHDGTPPEFRVPGYPWTPLGFIVPGVLVVTLVAAGHPIQSLAGAAAVATGLLVWPRLNANAARDRLVGASGSIAGRSR